jgi:hypothetical protein
MSVKRDCYWGRQWDGKDQKQWEKWWCVLSDKIILINENGKLKPIKIIKKEHLLERNMNRGSEYDQITLYVHMEILQ